MPDLSLRDIIGNYNYTVIPVGTGLRTLAHLFL